MDFLYKYVTAPIALISLAKGEDGTLRATQPSALNDPFECAVRFVEVEGGEAVEEATINEAYARGLTDINSDCPITPSKVDRARKRFGSLYARELLARQLSTRFGIVSFSENHLNVLMWSHYTKDGSGFVIGYDIRELRKLGRTRSSLRRVKYRRELFPVGVGLDEHGEHARYRSPNLPWYIPLSWKSQHWSYEKEWRLIVELNQTFRQEGNDDGKEPVNLIRVPNEAVVSVHYTERTASEAVNEVRERLADPNNRYTAGCPKKLVLSQCSYAYVEEIPN